MGENTPFVPPDLASILATLSQFAPPVHAQQSVPEVVLQHQAWQESDYQTLVSEDPRRRPRSRTPQPQQPLIDPATITEWSAGLRCVSKIAAQNQRFAETIKKMMHDQRNHEMQWYASRQSLKQDQAKRGANSGALQSILKSVGGSAVDEEHKLQSQEEKDVELAAFDAKIYKAQVQMNHAMTAELKGLGVPFFGTRVDCIRPEGDSNVGEFVERQKWSPQVTDTELRDLQRRMISYLEDMYKD